MAYQSYGGPGGAGAPPPNRTPSTYSHYGAHPASSHQPGYNQYQQQQQQQGYGGGAPPHRTASVASSSYPGQQQQQQQGPGYPAGGGGAPTRAQTMSRPQIPPCPPGASPKHWKWFHTVDTDHSGQISPQELQQALINGDHSQFDMQTIIMLFGMFDLDRSGSIGFDEFASIFDYVEQWQGIFRKFDADRSGTIEPDELSSALRTFQYNLSPRLIELLCKKYGSIAVPGQSRGGITFDRFVRCCVSVRSLTNAFIEVDTDRDGWVSISYEQFLDMALSAP